MEGLDMEKVDTEPPEPGDERFETVVHELLTELRAAHDRAPDDDHPSIGFLLDDDGDRRLTAHKPAGFQVPVVVYEGPGYDGRHAFDRDDVGPLWQEVEEMFDGWVTVECDCGAHRFRGGSKVSEWEKEALHDDCEECGVNVAERLDAVLDAED